MKVNDVMHKGTSCVEPSTAVWEIARQMRDNDIGAMPVWADGKLVGMVTDRDITVRGVVSGKDLAKLTARDVMTAGVIYCRDTETVDEAARIMESKQVRRLPVIDANKRMVGMISLGDVSHAASKKIAAEVTKAVSAHHA